MGFFVCLVFVFLHPSLFWRLHFKQGTEGQVGLQFYVVIGGWKLNTDEGGGGRRELRLLAEDGSGGQ